MMGILIVVWKPGLCSKPCNLKKRGDTLKGVGFTPSPPYTTKDFFISPSFMIEIFPPL